MKKVLHSFLFLFSLSPIATYAQFWTSCNAVPDSSFDLAQYSRHECGAVYANIDGHRLAIVIGGRAGAGKVDKKRPIIYDVDANTLTMGGNADDQYHHFQAAIWRDSIIVVGMSFDNGYPNEIPQTHLHLYYIRSQTWVQLDTVPTARARGSAQCVVVNDTAYFFNGLTDGHKSGWVNYTDKYDLVNGVWDTLAPSPHARDHAVALLDGDNVYMVGGRRSATGNGGLNAFPVYEIDVYHIPTDTWTTLPAPAILPELRGGHQAAIQVNTIGNKQINMWGGEIDGTALITGIGIDLNTYAWHTLPDLEAQVHGSAIVPVSNDTLVLIAGRDIAAEHLISDSFYVELYVGSPAPLPLQWLSANAAMTSTGNVAFRWSVDAPANGTFVIQQRNPAGSWRDLGKVPTQESQEAYAWELASPTLNTNQPFRIHLRLQDGTQSFSPTLFLGASEQQIRFQNPISAQHPVIELPEGLVRSADLFSLDGKWIATVEAPTSWQLPQGLAQGRYVITFRLTSGAVASEVLVVE